jgi:hypothetical protein
MHPLFQRADELSRTVIGGAIEVHRLKGPGPIESIYDGIDTGQKQTKGTKETASSHLRFLRCLL